MSEVSIVKQFTKFIFPFRYSRNDTNLSSAKILNNKGKELNIFLPFSQKSEGLRKGINELLLENGESAKIAECFKLNHDCRILFGLPQKKMDSVTFISRPTENKPYKVTVDSVNVYLFESEVGFVEVECFYFSDNIQDCIECNYFIGETKSEANIFSYERKISKDKTEKISFTLKQLVQKILHYVNGVRDLQKDDVPDFNANKSIIYSYILVNSKPEDIENLLFTLRRNYKGSYKVPCNKTLNTDTRIKQQFENSYWAASLNGAVNLSFLTDDETTNNFFKNDFYSKLHDTYFSLFLHALHQRFALMKYLGDMGELDTLENDYIVMKKELKVAEDYYAKATNLKFRAFFKLPSNIEHINEYYNLLLRSFNVNELKVNFESDIQSLTNICKTYVNRIKQREDKIIERRKKKIEIFVSIIGTLVAVVTLINSYWSLLEKLIGKAINFWSIQILVFIGALLIPLVTVIIDVVNSVRDINKMTKELNDEVADNLVESDSLRKHRKRLSRKLSSKSVKRHKKNS